MRIGEAKLDETGALVDRGRRHRGSAREVADLDDDFRIADEFLGDCDRLARVGLAVLEDILQRTVFHAALGVDLFEREVETFFPLRAILRVLSGQRPADANRDRFAARNLCGSRRGAKRAKPHRQDGRFEQAAES
jgi:hypothetical protein